MENLNQVDDMVCEYLLFRGFTNTFKTFEDDRNNDRTQGFNVDKIVTRLFQLIDSLDYKGLNDTWNFLNSRFFCLLDSSYKVSVDNFWNSLRKLYIITCINKKNYEEVTKFFSLYCPNVLTLSDESNKNDDWRRWCSLPYISNPDKDSYFMQFFSESWKGSLKETLINFLRAIFQNLLPPSLLGISIFKTERQSSQAQIKTCKSETALARQECQQAKDNYNSLLKYLSEIKECVDNSKPDSLQSDLQVILNKIPMSQLLDPDLNDIPEVDEFGPSLSRQLSSEIAHEETDDVIQAVTVTEQEEIGVYSEGCMWSRDGKRFAAGGGEGQILIYNFDADTAKSELYSSYPCGNEVLSLDWGYLGNSTNSNLIVYGTQEGCLGVYNTIVNSSVFDRTIDGVSHVVTVNFSPLMNSYCSALMGSVPSLQFWDLATGKNILDSTAMGTDVKVNCFNYLPNGAGLFCGCKDGHVRLFDIRSGKGVSDEKICNGELSAVKLIVNEPNDGSATLFTCSTDGIVREFDYPIPKATISYSSSARLLAIAANHLDGMCLFNRGQSAQAYNDALLTHLSNCADLCPSQNVLIASSTDCSLEMLKFDAI